MESFHWQSSSFRMLLRKAGNVQNQYIGSGDIDQWLYSSSSSNRSIIEPENGALETVTVAKAWNLVGYRSSELQIVVEKSTITQEAKPFSFAILFQDYIHLIKLIRSVQKVLPLSKRMLKKAFHVKKCRHHISETGRDEQDDNYSVVRRSQSYSTQTD